VTEPVIFLVIKLFFCYCSIIMKLQDNKNVRHIIMFAGEHK